MTLTLTWGLWVLHATQRCQVVKIFYFQNSSLIIRVIDRTRISIFESCDPDLDLKTLNPSPPVKHNYLPSRFKIINGRPELLTSHEVWWTEEQTDRLRERFLYTRYVVIKWSYTTRAKWLIIIAFYLIANVSEFSTGRH